MIRCVKIRARNKQGETMTRVELIDRLILKGYTLSFLYSHGYNELLELWHENME